MTRTAKQRIEQAVDKAVQFASGNRGCLPLGEVQYIMREEILAERARLRLWVRKRTITDVGGDWDKGYNMAIKDILAALQQGGKK